MNCKDQGTEFEFTVVQKINQGSFPKSGGYRFRGSFFVSFLEKQKRKISITINIIKINCFSLLS